jgi:hypothetical protein
MLKAKKPTKKRKAVMVRFTPEQFAAVQAAALEAGLEVAVFCRTSVLVAASGGGEIRLRGNVLDDGAPSKKGRRVPPPLDRRAAA